MKKIILILLITFSFVGVAYSPCYKSFDVILKESINPYLELYEAIIQVESDANPLAYNPLEGATGIAQIRQIRIDDYNIRTGKNYLLRDCYNPDLSKTIFMYYASKYNPEDKMLISRAWNGQGKSSIDYWHKVDSLLKRNII